MSYWECMMHALPARTPRRVTLHTTAQVMLGTTVQLIASLVDGHWLCLAPQRSPNQQSGAGGARERFFVTAVRHR